MIDLNLLITIIIIVLGSSLILKSVNFFSLFLRLRERLKLMTEEKQIKEKIDEINNNIDNTPLDKLVREQNLRRGKNDRRGSD